MVFTSCDPLEDINKEVDAQASAIIGDAEYTLTEDDYAIYEKELDSVNYFQSEDQFKELIPDLLTAMYPVWGNNSSVLVNYQLYVGSAPGVSDYTDSEEYSLALTDYPGSADNAVAFYEDEDATELVSEILASNFADSEEGDVVLAKYSEYIGETVNGITEFYSANFASAGSLLDFETVSVSGDQVWAGTNYGAKMTGYDGGTRYVNEDWLVSSDIDLSSFPNSSLEVSQIFNYGDASGFSVLISTDYTDDVTTATWDVIDLTNVPDGTSWDEYLSDAYSLSAYNGETINIAFKYTSTDSDAGTYEVISVSLKAPGVEGETNDVAEFYTYESGSWELSEGVYYLSNADFDSMGEEYGQPGKYDNFSSSINPDDYLPTFLNVKYPYALEEDEMIVIYDYYDSGTQLGGNLYAKESGVWSGFESTISTALQFSHDGTTWVPDNTIKYTLLGDDYSYMAAQLEGNPDFNNVSLDNLASYSDYDYNWEDDQIIYSLDLLLDYLAPTAEDGQKYQVTYLLYDNGTSNVTRYLIKENGEWVLNE